MVQKMPQRILTLCLVAGIGGCTAEAPPIPLEPLHRPHAATCDGAYWDGYQRALGLALDTLKRNGTEIFERHAKAGRMGRRQRLAVATLGRAAKRLKRRATRDVAKGGTTP